MGRSPCCEKVGLKKGPWTPEEDQKLLAYIEEHGHGSWRALPSKAGLQRCGKSCRLRWTNYLRPDIKRGKFSLQEEQTIIQLHALLGNRWSAIATHLPKRTDNEIKNYWNTHLKKRLAKMGIDPVSHKPKNDTLMLNDGHSKSSANLSHMAQWESARLEAEARLVKQSKLHSSSLQNQHLNQLGSFEPSAASKPVGPMAGPPSKCLDILKAWNGVWGGSRNEGGGSGIGDLDSPTSTLSTTGIGENSTNCFEFVGQSLRSSEKRQIGEKAEEEWKGSGSAKKPIEYRGGMGDTTTLSSGIHNTTNVNYMDDQNNVHEPNANFLENLTDLLLNKPGGDRGNFLEEDDDSGIYGGGHGAANGSANAYYDENQKNYWNSILNLLNASPSHSPMF